MRKSGTLRRSRGAVLAVVVGVGAAAVAVLLAFGATAASASREAWGPNDPDPPFGLHETTQAANWRATHAISQHVAAMPAPGGRLSGPSRTSGGNVARKDATAATSTAQRATILAAAAADATVPVGDLPLGVAVTNSRAYVANGLSNSVSVLDLTTVPATVMATIPVGSMPVGVALSADASQAYVTNYNGSSLSIVSTATNTVTNTVTVGSRPGGVIRIGATVYVANLTGNSISVVNPATATVTNTVVLGGSPPIAPNGMAANAGGTRLYVTDAKNGKLLVLDATVTPPTVLSTTTTVGAFPAYMSVASSTGYVANPGSNTVSVVNLAVSPPTVTATVPVGTADYGVVAQPSLGQVFVTNSGSNNGTVIDSGTNTAVGTFPTGTTPNAIVMTPDGSKAVFTNQGSDSVSVLHVNQKPVNTVPGAQNVNGNATAIGNKITFSPGNANTISTADDSETTVQVTVSSLHGSIALSTTLNLTGVSGDGTHTVMFTGAVAAVNTALNGLTYTPDTAYFGPDTLTLTVNDQGNTGIGKAQSDVDTVSITVVNAAPVVGSPSFSGAVGNTTFGVGQTPAKPSTNTAGTVLTGSSDPNGGTITAVAGTITSANGATVSMSTNGTFTYVSAPGFSGADTFTFTVTDGSLSTNGTATVTVANRVWYANNALGVNGNGTSVSPFNTLANLRGAGDVDGPGDYVFLYTGASNYAGGLPLEANQQLIGQPQDLVVGAQTLWTGAGTNPTITNTAGVGIALAQNNVIRRVNVANTSSAGINGSGINNTDIGPNMSISGAGGAGFALFGGGSGTVSFAANVTHSNASGRSVFFGGRTGGTVTVSGSVTDTAGGVQLDTNTGTTFSFTGGLAISGATETFKATGGGTVTVTGTNTLSSTLGSALNVTSTTIGASGLTFQSISANGAANGIILNGTGSLGGLTVTGTGAAGSGGTIQNASGDGISITSVGGVVSLTNMATSNVTGTDVSLNGGGADVTYAGTITNQAGKGRSVIVQNKTGGTVAFSGAINDSGTGLQLSTNTGATINFTGGLVMSTAASAAFDASGGGTVTVTGSNNTIDTTTGSGLSVANTTIGGSGMTFKRISAGTVGSGPTNGILLNNTGASGGLTVAGDGSANSGGTIQRTSGDAVSLTSTRNVNLSRMRIINNLGSGIIGTTVTNFNIDNSTLDTNGDDAASDEAGIRFTNLAGTSTWTNVTVANGIEDNARIINTTAALTQLTITGSTFRDTPTVSPGNNGLLLQSDGGSITADIVSSSFLRNRANGLQVITNSSGSVNVEVGNGTAGSGGTFQDNNIGASIAHNSSGTLPFKVNNASFSAPTKSGTASPINLNLGGAATGSGMQGTVANNTITNANSATGPGIRVVSNGTGTMTVQLSSNNISQIANRGIEVIARDGSSTINATILSNTVTLTNALSADAIRADAGAVSTDTTKICADIRMNNATTIAGLFGIRVRQRFVGTTYTLEGYAGAPTDDAAVQTFLSTNNNGATTSADHAGAGFGTTASCPTPT